MNTSIPRPSRQVKLEIPDVSGMTCKEAAHAYLEAGFWPIPWRPFKGEKIVCYGDFSYRTLPWETHELIDKWRSTWRTGLVVSPRSGILAADIDDPDGFASWEISAEPPDTATSETGRDGGFHLVYDGSDLANWPVQGSIPGGDVKSNGFIAVPPSKHPNGKKYRWVGDRAVASIGRFGKILYEYRNADRVSHNGGGSRGDLDVLRRELLSAGDGAQYPALLAYTNELENSMTSEAVRHVLVSLLGVLHSYPSRKGPWNERGILSGMHRTGKVPDATAREEIELAESGDFQPEVAPPAAEKKFWDAHPVLRHIRAWALSRRASPWAVLGECMCEAVCHTPPTLQLPPLVGGNGSLNMLVALTGKSGAGKDAAESAAAEAFSWSGVPGIIDDSVPRIPLGSGEGLARNFGYTYRNPDTGKNEVVRTDESVIVTITEIDTFSAVQGRSGSTLSPELRKLYNGQALGFGYADPSKRVIIEKHSYRSCVISGVQPGRGNVILGDIEGGFAQRWLWLPAEDPYAPRSRSQISSVMPWSPPDIDYDAVMVMPVCDAIVDSTDEVRFETLRGTGSDIDSHSQYTRIKVAAALALLFGQWGISDEVWELSQYVMKVSGRTRASVVAVLSAGAIARSEEEGKLHGVRTAAAHDAEVDTRVEKNLLKYLSDLGRGEWIAKRSLIGKLNSRDKAVGAVVLGRLVSDGKVQKDSFEYKGTPGTKYRLSRGGR